MAGSDRSLDRIESPVAVAQPISIGPRQAEQKNEDGRKERRRRRSRPSIEETLEQEQLLREQGGENESTHIDYHA